MIWRSHRILKFSSRLARFSLIVSLETHLNWYRMGLVG